MYKIRVFGSSAFQAQTWDHLTVFLSFVKPGEMFGVVKAKVQDKQGEAFPAYFENEDEANLIASTLTQSGQYSFVDEVHPSELNDPHYTVSLLGPLFELNQSEAA